MMNAAMTPEASADFGLTLGELSALLQALGPREFLEIEKLVAVALGLELAHEFGLGRLAGPPTPA